MDLWGASPTLKGTARSNCLESQGAGLTAKCISGVVGSLGT